METTRQYILSNKEFVVSAIKVKGGITYTGALFKDEGEKDMQLLEQYFNDLYGVFLKRLTSLATSARVGDLECAHLKAMLDELLKVKGMLEKHSDRAAE